MNAFCVPASAYNGIRSCVIRFEGRRTICNPCSYRAITQACMGLFFFVHYMHAAKKNQKRSLCGMAGYGARRAWPGAKPRRRWCGRWSTCPITHPSGWKPRRRTPSGKPARHAIACSPTPRALSVLPGEPTLPSGLWPSCAWQNFRFSSAGCISCSIV